MNRKLTVVAVAVCAALGLSSCVVYDYPVYTSASVGVSGHGWSTSVAWTDARYDVNGFPIYGYSYGQPVYGYTASGAAVFSFAALTAGCFVPSWGPAHWYCGHWHYPRHIHRVSVPKRYPTWHHPGRKPSGHHKPVVNHRPAVSHKPVVNHRPAVSHKPAVNHRPSVSHKPAVNHRPSVSHKPAVNHRPAVSHKPAVNHRPQVQRPQVQRPQMQRPVAKPRPQVQRSHASRSSHGGGRPGGHPGHRR